MKNHHRFVRLSLALQIALMFSVISSFAQIAGNDSGQSTAQTGPALPQNSQTTYYNQLKTLYTNGTLPSQDDVTGWFAGRCFQQISSDGGTSGSLLVGMPDQNGPLFHDLKLMSIESDCGQDCFDTLTSQETAEINSEIKSNIGYYDASFVQDNALDSINPAAGSEFRVRKNGSYLIGALGYESDTQNARDPWAYCYYFKKVMAVAVAQNESTQAPPANPSIPQAGDLKSLANPFDPDNIARK